MGTNATFGNQSQNISTFLCDGNKAHLVFTVALLAFGPLANVPLLLYCIHQIKINITPDKILILNLATTDVLALFTCLPMHINDIVEDSVNASDHNISVCHWGFTLLLVFFFTNLSTLATIAVDRFDALTRFAHERKFGNKTALYATTGLWTLSILVGMVTCRDETTTIAFCVYISDESLPSIYKDLIARVVVITVFVTTCCSVVSQFLTRAARQIMKHRKEMEEMFGPREREKKVAFTKNCIAFSFAYIMTWVPFGIVAMVYTFFPSNVTFCVYQWSNTCAFVSFMVIPIVYMVMDTRVLETVHKMFRCWQRRVEDVNAFRSKKAPTTKSITPNINKGPVNNKCNGSTNGKEASQAEKSTCNKGKREFLVQKQLLCCPTVAMNNNEALSETPTAMDRYISVAQVTKVQRDNSNQAIDNNAITRVQQPMQNKILGNNNTVIQVQQNDPRNAIESNTNTPGHFCQC